MANKNYIKGVRKERELVNKAREKGLIAFRSSGSHSPIDVSIIDSKNKEVIFIQVKNKKIYGKEKKELEKLKKLSGDYKVIFEVWSKE